MAERRGAGLLSRSTQVRLLPGTPMRAGASGRLELRPRGRAERRWSSKPADAGSTPAEDTSTARERRNDSSLVMRLASQLHCLWSETGSIPVRGAGPSARTERATNVARALGLQSHGDRPGLQTPERGFDSFAARRTSGISTSRAARRSSTGRWFNRRTLHSHCRDRGASPRRSTQRNTKEHDYELGP